ncbi:MAG: polyamine aminopropyltransferase [Chloroflexi bacterium]|nr:polyamine aminopropyltransferase [Chloroflexota bacterium]
MAPADVFGGDWHFEIEREGFAQGVRVLERIFRVTTPFQTLEIFDTKTFGRALVLDDALQTTERDEFTYHEMIVHVSMMTHPTPRRVLIIGGGDGGTLRRVLEYASAEPVQVEIDRAVIDACKRYIPSISAGSFDNPRAQVVIGDGVEHMHANAGGFDVVIVDSTDPVGPAVQLFATPFYQSVARSLADDGIVVAQSSSPLIMAEAMRQQVTNMREVFPIVHTYLGLVPAYPGGLWSYTIGSKRYEPLGVSPETIAERLARDRIQTRYYTPEVHRGAFPLPPFVADILA